MFLTVWTVLTVFRVYIPLYRINSNLPVKFPSIRLTYGFSDAFSGRPWRSLQFLSLPIIGPTETYKISPRRRKKPTFQNMVEIARQFSHHSIIMQTSDQTEQPNRVLKNSSMQSKWGVQFFLSNLISCISMCTAFCLKPNMYIYSSGIRAIIWRVSRINSLTYPFFHRLKLSYRFLH